MTTETARLAARITDIEVFGVEDMATASTLTSCDVCEDDHESVVLADGTTACARDGIGR